MADTGAILPGLGETEDRGKPDWSNPRNIEAGANSASCVLASFYGTSDWLRASQFGFSIPAGSTIDGIRVRVNRSASAVDVIDDNSVRLVNASGTSVGDDKQQSVKWPTIADTAIYGGDEDTWAASPTVDMVNSANFGVRLYAINTDEASSRTAYVAWVSITIYYTEPPTTTILPATSIITDEARINAEVLSDGGAACEGRFCWAEIEKEDDFEWGSDGDPLSDDGGSLDWTIDVAGTSVAEIEDAGGVPYAGTRCARLHRDGSNNLRAQFPQTAGEGYDIRFRFRKDATSYAFAIHGNGTKRIILVVDASENVKYYDEDGTLIDTGYNVTVGTWHLFEFKNLDWTAGTFDLYFDRDLIADGAEMQTNATYANIISFNNVAGTSNVYIDNVLVTKEWTLTSFANGLTTDDPFYSDLTSLSTGTRHVYEAQLQNSAGEGLWSAEATFSTSTLATSKKASFFQMLT